jgi:hypothetical protein
MAVETTEWMLNKSKGWSMIEIKRIPGTNEPSGTH